MKSPDLDRVQSEQKRSQIDFLTVYNGGLPTGFPRASHALLGEFKKTYPNLFKTDTWTLDVHRKRFMDWLPQYQKSLQKLSELKA